MEERTTRNRILEEAAGLFRRDGFNGASMQDLAGVVGITKSTLYHHFPSKQALLSEILELTVDHVACFIGEGRFLAPEYRQSHIAKRDRYERHFRKVVADGIRDGEFRPLDV